MIMSKIFGRIFTIAIMFFCCPSADAQLFPNSPASNNRPEIFTGISDSIKFDVQLVNQVFGAAINSTVVLRFSQSFEYKGVIISAGRKYNSAIETVMIRSDNYDRTIFTISKITGMDGRIRLSGHILSFVHADGYEIAETSQGFLLVKKKYSDLINE